MKAHYENTFPAISKIRIEKLFGKYDYYITSDQKNIVDFSRLIIFYGDNGTGKTTILKLIYNLLTPKRRGGHKSFLAKIRFKNFEIEFNDGTSIKVYRSEKRIIGSYSVSISENGGEVLNINLKATRDNKINEDYLSIRERRNYRELLRYLSDMTFSLYFLSDDRKFQFYSEDIYYDPLDYEYEFDEELRSIVIGEHAKRRKRSRDILRDAIDRAVKWLNLQISEALGKGEIDVNNIYSEIIASFAKISTNEEIAKKDMNEIIDQLKNLSKRSDKYSYFKISSPLNINQIVNSILTAPTGTHKTISSILEPYINGIKAKLDALEDILKLLNTIIHTLNTFLFDKYVQFKYNEGLFVYTSENEELNFNSLSSGEKQLLMLFCNTLPARETTCIFMIDEPEISLNVKWQRKLIQSLIELTKDKQVQFIFATHSIELLSQYRTNVARLKPKFKK